MIDVEELNKKTATVEGKKDHFLAAWYSIKRVIKEEIPEPSDVGFLMIVMGNLARQVKDTTKVQKIKLPLNEWVGAWHCINICLQNKLFTSEGQEAMMCQILSFIAIQIDATQQLHASPLESESPPAHVEYDPSGLEKATDMAKEGELAPVVKHTKEGLQLIEGGRKE